MSYNKLDDLTRRFLRGVEPSKENKIFSILESLSLNKIKDRKNIEIVKGLIRELQRQNARLSESNSSLKKINENKEE